MATESKSMAERLAKVEEWVEGHEARCEDRLNNLLGGMADLKDSQKTMRNAAWAVVISVLGFAGAQLYNGLKPPPPAAVAVAVPAPVPR